MPLEPRRAAVALIIRLVPPPSFPLPLKPATPPSLTEFFDYDWVKHPSARPEILFVRRQKPNSADLNENTRDAHVAFPGGRTEEGDEGGLYTGTQSLVVFLSVLTLLYSAMRQTWEEIGLDLAESDFTCVGQLDDREITTSLGKRLLMILSPFGQLSPSPSLLFPLNLSKFSSNLPQLKYLPSLFPRLPSIGYH